jgi:hypothetical protein
MCSPLTKQQAKKNVVEKAPVLPLFKAEKLTLTKSEARKVLHTKVELGQPQIRWCQNWLTQRIRERCLPPQLAGGDAFSQIVLFLSPSDASALFSDIRADFEKTLPPKPEDGDDVSFLALLANEAYHEYQPPLPSSDHNSPKSDASP